VAIAGQYLWIKRAANEEEEKDAIVDLHVTLGKSKNSNDKIWTKPGVGWLQVPGNFNKGMFVFTDAFLWFRPLRTPMAQAGGPTIIGRGLGGSIVSEETRHAKILSIVRTSIRHHVPVTEMARVANVIGIVAGGGGGPPTAPPPAPAAAGPTELAVAPIAVVSAAAGGGGGGYFYDFASLYHQYDPAGKNHLSRRKFALLLYDIGVRLDSADATRVYNSFDTSLEGGVSGLHTHTHTQHTHTHNTHTHTIVHAYTHT